MFSKLTNSSCSRFSAFFTSIFITLHHYTAFSLSIREKGHQKVTFFDRLRARTEQVRALWLTCGYCRACRRVVIGGDQSTAAVEELQGVGAVREIAVPG